MSIPELSLQGQIVDQNRYSAGAGVYFSTDLNLRTEEGDVVNLSFDTEQSYSETQSETRFADGFSVQQFSAEAVAASQYSLVVQGDLNEEELAAIRELTQEIAPIAQSFFNKEELDLAKVQETLAGNPGALQEIELALKKTVATAVFVESYSLQQIPEEAGVAAAPVEQPVEAETEISAIRDVPELVSVVLEVQFQSQIVTDFPPESILKTLGDLLAFFREQLGSLLDPLHDGKKVGGQLELETDIDQGQAA